MNETTQPANDATSVLGQYKILKESAGLLLFDSDGILRVQGRDRVAWLHKLVTVDIANLAEGRGAYGLLLNGTAHVVADFVVLAESDSFLLYSSRQAKDKLYAQLHRSIFREHVSLERLDETLCVLSVQGPSSRQVVDAAFGPLPAVEPFQFSRNGDLLTVRNARAGDEGYDLIIPRAQVAQIRTALTGNGARDVSLKALDVARIEAGIPWYGEDFDETILAPEARLDSFVAENKGCYPGQEVIARIRNRGHVNRLLVQLVFDGDTIPQRGDLIYWEDREVGWITSAAWSYSKNAPMALGYLRRDTVEKDTRLEAARGTERIQARLLGP